MIARLIVIIFLVGRGSWCRDCSFRLSSRRAGRHVRLVVASRLLVSGSGEALVSRFIPTVSGGAAVLVLLSRWRCLLALMPSENEVMSFSSSVFPSAPCHHLTAGRRLMRRSHLAHRRLLLVSRAYCSIASCRLPD